ncbi:xanthine dehydrogenase family protein subunit M [Brevibacterium daeguense]|uniref:Xanthine dehydrogenase family protein subunit M n=1 Tax=Brevibacterium daeguense TaxID=909936 RepID=A0ABP8EGZ7_9MICO|nr:FAD binding domain-containing protein [Brevibacterium daeguense]
MKPAPLTCHSPTTLDEAVRLLHDLGPEAKVIAGGQSLVPVLNMRLATPAHLVDITGLPGLDEIRVSAEAVEVGALVTHRRLEQDDAAHAALPLLRQALVNVAHPAIRNRGTTVGSLAHADPNGEMPMILALTGGSVTAASVRGERTITASELFVGPMETVLEPDEILVSARFGRFAEGTRTAFTELTRRSGDYALAGAALALQVSDGQLRTARMGFVSVTELPDALDLTELVAGRPASTSADIAEAVVERVTEHIAPESDIHATADYRRHLTGVLARRLLTELTADIPARGAA